MQLLNRRLVTFGLVGAVNTLMDFAVYLIILQATSYIVLANIVATSIALTVSWFLNKKFTFKSQSPLSKKRFIAFAVVTLFGLWVLQTGAIYALSPAVNTIFTTAPESMRLLIPKIIATGLSLVWNYLWYSRVIFKTKVTEPAL